MEEKEERMVQKEPETTEIPESAVKKRFVNPENIEKEKRQYISLRNERERHKLLEQIAIEEEEERREQERLAKLRDEKRKNSVLFRLQGKLVEKITAPKPPKPPKEPKIKQEQAKIVRKEKRAALPVAEECHLALPKEQPILPGGGPAASPAPAADEACPAADEAHSLKEACARIRNDKYVFFYVEPANMEYFLAKGDAESVLECKKIIERCGKRIWQGQFYKYEDTDAYCALLPDCRLNADALKKVGDNFLFSIKEFSVNDKYQACYGYAFGRPGASMELIIREAVQNCKKQRSAFLN